MPTNRSNNNKKKKKSNGQRQRSRPVNVETVRESNTTMPTNRSNNNEDDEVARKHRIESFKTIVEELTKKKDVVSHHDSQLCWETLYTRMDHMNPNISTVTQAQCTRFGTENYAKYKAAFMEYVGKQRGYVVTYLDYMEKKEYSKLMKLVGEECSENIFSTLSVALAGATDGAKASCERQFQEMRLALLQLLVAKKYSMAKLALQKELAILQSFEG